MLNHRTKLPFLASLVPGKETNLLLRTNIVYVFSLPSHSIFQRNDAENELDIEEIQIMKTGESEQKNDKTTGK